MNDLDVRLEAAGYTIVLDFDKPINPVDVAAVFGDKHRQAVNDLYRLALKAPAQPQRDQPEPVPHVA